MSDSQSHHENSDSPRNNDEIDAIIIFSHCTVVFIFRLILGSQKNANSPEASDNKSEFEKSTLRPGECVMRTLFQDFTQQAARKMEEVMAEPMVCWCFYSDHLLLHIISENFL